MEQNFIPGLGGLLQPSTPSTFPVENGIDSSSLGSEDRLRLNDLFARRGPGLGYIGDGNHNNRPMPLPGLIGGGNFIGLQPPMLQRPIMPDYSGQFEKFGEQLTGFGDQMTGYQDALGSFNEQVGGMSKQFETINNRLDSVDKGLGSLGNQIASFENMQKAQPQQVMQPQRPAFSPFGFGGFGGLGSLFGRRY
jgi:hypothetical protein